MTQIVFKHLRNTHNLGDRNCSPFDYFDYNDAIAIDMAEAAPKTDVVIYGGGKIFRQLHRDMSANEHAARVRIGWGLSTVQKNPFSWRYHTSRRSLDLIGSRDYQVNTKDQFAPCASCMSPLFDKSYDTQHEIGMYLHHDKSAQFGQANAPIDARHMFNDSASFEEVIRFLGESHTVISNSYHGVYWALLLGKKVICVPFSNKFNHYRLPPAYSNAQDWRAQLKTAPSYTDMLAICRAATMDFKQQVDQRIYG